MRLCEGDYERLELFANSASGNAISRVERIPVGGLKAPYRTAMSPDGRRVVLSGNAGDLFFVDLRAGPRTSAFGKVSQFPDLQMDWKHGLLYAISGRSEVLDQRLDTFALSNGGAPVVRRRSLHFPRGDWYRVAVL